MNRESPLFLLELIRCDIGNMALTYGASQNGIVSLIYSHLDQLTEYVREQVQREEADYQERKAALTKMGLISTDDAWRQLRQRAKDRQDI